MLYIGFDSSTPLPPNLISTCLSLPTYKFYGCGTDRSGVRGGERLEGFFSRRVSLGPAALAPYSIYILRLPRQSGERNPDKWPLHTEHTREKDPLFFSPASSSLTLLAFPPSSFSFLLLSLLWLRVIPWTLNNQTNVFMHKLYSNCSVV